MTENVRILGTKHNVVCTKCGRRWGVYLDAGNRLPEGWDVCLKCASETLDVKGECKDEKENQADNTED